MRKLLTGLILLSVLLTGKRAAPIEPSALVEHSLYLPIVATTATRVDLLNPSFEMGEGGTCRWTDAEGQHEECPREARPPDHWEAYWYNRWADVCPPYLTGQPEILVFEEHLDSFRVKDGDKSAKLFTFWRCHRMGLRQAIRDVPPGTYQASAWVQTWFSECSDQPYSTQVLWKDCQPIGWAHLYVRIGLGDGATTTWGPWREAYNVWTLLTVDAQVSTGHVTVIVELESDAPLKHQDGYIDGVALERIAP